MAGKKQKHTKGKVNKGTNQSEWLKNVAKSIGYISEDTVKSMIPSTFEFIDNNKEFVSEGYQKFREASKNGIQKMLKDAVSSATKDIQDIAKNSIEDIKSGKIYNREREMKSANEASGFGGGGLDEWEDSLDFGDVDDGFDVDLDFGDQDVDSGSDVIVPDINISANINEDNPMVTAVNRQSKTLIDIEKSRSKREVGLGKANLSFLTGMQESMSSGLSSVNENLSMLVDFHSNNTNKLIDGSLDYFDKSYNKLDEILNELKSFNKSQSSDGFSSYDSDDDIFGYGFNLKAYIKNIKENIIEELSSNPITSSVMSANMQAQAMGGNLLSQISANPLGLLSTSVVKKLIPETISTPLKELDETIKELPAAIGIRLADYADNSNDFSQKGKLYKMFARVFGVDSNVKKSIYLGNTSLDEQTTFDGKTKEAIITVIPTYLSKILSNISAITKAKGYETIAPDLYNYKTGMWESPEKIYYEYREGLRNAATSAYDFNKFNDIIDSIATTDERSKEIFKRKLVDTMEQLTEGELEIPFLKNDFKLEDWIESAGFEDNEAEIAKTMFQMLSKKERSKLFGSSIYEARKNLTEYRKSIESDSTNMARYIYSGAFGKYFDNYENIDKSIRMGKKEGLDSEAAVRYDALVNPENKRVQLNTLQLNRLKKENPADYEALTRIYKFLNVKGNDVADLKKSDRELYKKYHPTNGKVENDNIDEEVYEDDPNLTKKENARKRADVDKRNKEKREEQARKEKKRAEERGQYYVPSWDKVDADELRENYFDVYSVPKRDEEDEDKIPRPNRIGNRFARIIKSFLGPIGGGPNLPLSTALKYRQGGPTVNEEVKKKSKDVEDKVVSAIEGATNTLYDTIFGSDEKTEDEYRKRPLLKRIDNKIGGLVDNIDGKVDDLNEKIKDKIVGEDGLIDNIKDSKTVQDATKSLKSKWLGIDDDDEGIFDGFKRGEGKLYGAYDTVLQGFAKLKSDLFGVPNTLTTEEIVADMKEKAPQKLKGAGFGAIAGTLVGGASASMVGMLPAMFINPMMGLVLGMGGGILSKSESFKDWLFGKKDENDERVGGFISKTTQDFFKKHKKGIGVGAAVGGAAAAVGALPALPAMILGGPLLGAVTGLGVSVLKGSEDIKQKFFPDFDKMDEEQLAKFVEKHGDISEEDYKKKVKTRALITAGSGVLGAVLLGPVLGSALGVAAGLTATSDRFKERIFGKKGKNGARVGGLLGNTINKYQIEILNPLKIQMTKWGYEIQDWFDDTIKGNLKSAAEPIKRALKRGGNKFIDFADNLLDRIDTRLFGDNKKIKGGILTKLLHPGAFLGKALVNATLKVAKTVIGVPFNLLGDLGSYLVHREKSSGLRDYRKKLKSNLKENRKIKKELKDSKEKYSAMSERIKKDPSLKNDEKFMSVFNKTLESIKKGESSKNDTKFRDLVASFVPFTKGRRDAKKDDESLFGFIKRRRSERKERKEERNSKRAQHRDTINRMLELNDVNKQLVKKMTGATYDEETDTWLTKDGEVIDNSLIKNFNTDINKQMEGMYGKKWKKMSIEERENAKRQVITDMRAEKNEKNVDDITSNTGKLVEYMKLMVDKMDVIKEERENDNKVSRYEKETDSEYTKLFDNAKQGIMPANHVFRQLDPEEQEKLNNLYNGFIENKYSDNIKTEYTDIERDLLNRAKSGKNIDEKLLKNIDPSVRKQILDNYDKGSRLRKKVDERKKTKLSQKLLGVLGNVLKNKEEDMDNETEDSTSEKEGKGGPLLSILSGVGKLAIGAVKGVAGLGKSLVSGVGKKLTSDEKPKSKVSNSLIEGVKNYSNIVKSKAEAEEKSKWEIFRDDVKSLLTANLVTAKDHAKQWGKTFGKKGLITLLLLGMLASKKVREFLGSAVNTFFEKGVPWIKENVLAPVGEFVTGTVFPWLSEQLGKLLTGIWNKINPFNDDTDEVTGATLSDNDSKENIVTGAVPVAASTANRIVTSTAATAARMSSKGKLLVNGGKTVSNTLFGTKFNTLDDETKEKLKNQKGTSNRQYRKQKRKDAVNKLSNKYNNWIDKATSYGKEVDNLDDVAAKKNANAAKVTEGVAGKEGKINKFISYVKQGFDKLKSGIAKGMKKAGFKVNVEGISTIISKALTHLDATKLGKFIKPISKVLAKVGLNIASFGAGGVGGIIVNAAFGIWGAATGVTKSETANLFGINEDDVDWKMRTISSVLKAALNMGFMPILDLASDILYELSGFDFVREIATLLYKLISSDKNDKKLETAQDNFDKELAEYNAARKQVDPDAKDLTHAQYNDMTNKSTFTKIKESLFGTKKDDKKLQTAQDTKSKMDEQIKADPSLKDNEAYMKVYNDTLKTIKDNEGGGGKKYAAGIKGSSSILGGGFTKGEESAVEASKARIKTNSEKTWESMAKYSDEWSKDTIKSFETASSATSLQLTNMLGYTDTEGKLLTEVATSDAKSATTKKNTISSVLSGFWDKISNKVKSITKSEVAAGGPNNPINDWMITSDFGARQDPISGNAAFHTGIDLAKDTNKNIGAFSGGTVVNTGYDKDYGNNVTVQDDMGNFHRYGHMSSTTASIGQRVNRGDRLGYEGSTGRSTGSHLHYEVTDRYGNYEDPLSALGMGGPNIPLYNQKNYSNPYPGPGNPNATIASSGCGPTAISMVVEGLTGQKFDPVDSCAYSTEVGARATSGTNMKVLSPKVAEKFGLTYSTSSSEDDIISKLTAGNTAVIANSAGDGSVSGWRRLTGPENTHGGHYFVIGDYQDGRFKIYDPAPGKHSSGARKEKVIENSDGTFSISKDDIDKETKKRNPNYYIFTGSGMNSTNSTTDTSGSSTTTTTQSSSSGLYKVYETLSGVVDTLLGKGTSSSGSTTSGTSSGATSSSGGTFNATKYPLTDEQLQLLAGICNREQGDSIKGMSAEASLMANLFEKNGKKYGTGTEGLINYVCNSGWFGSASRNYGSASRKLSDEQKAAIRDVLENGNRTLPTYVDEHDCFSDITSATNDGESITKSDRSAYVQDKTIIKNRYGSTYTFYCFPDTDSDPFGYTQGPASGGKLLDLARRVGGYDTLTDKMKLIKITSGYPMRNSPLTIGNLSNVSKTNKSHAGVDLCFEGGDQAQILSFTSGKVKYAGEGVKGSGYGNYGNVVGILDNSGYEHVYAHLRDTPLVKVGDAVQEGQPIGYEGSTGHSTGNHLHYEVRNGAWNNTVNPIEYLKGYVTTGDVYTGDGTTSSTGESSAPSSGLYKVYETLSGVVDTLLGKGVTTTTSTDSSTENGSTDVSSLSGSNPDKVWQFLTGNGYSKEATAGIMGNLRQESGQDLDPSTIQGGGSGPAAGIAQWENYNKKSARWKQMSDYATSKGKEWTDLQSQLEFIDMELSGTGNVDTYTSKLLNKNWGGINNLKNSTDINWATDAFEKTFERAGKPNMSNRYKYAKEFYDKYANAGGPNVPISGRTIPIGTSLTSVLNRYGSNNINNNPTFKGGPEESIRQLSSMVRNSSSSKDANMSEILDKIVAVLTEIANNTKNSSDGIESLATKDFSNNNIIMSGSSTTNNAMYDIANKRKEELNKSDYNIARSIAAGS